MRSTRPSVLDGSPESLDAIWTSLAPEAAPATGSRSACAHTETWEPSPAEPRLRAVMIASIDGTTTIDGRSGSLGTPTDKLVYDAMRARADLVVVGSGTVLTEEYGPARVSQVWADRRQDTPPVVVALTRTLSDRLVDHCAAVGDGVQIATSHSVDAERLEAARARGVTVHVLEPGPLGAAIRSLAAGLGAGEVCVEGGPRLLGELLAEGAVDELVLSVAPEIVLGGGGSRLTSGPDSGRIPMRVVNAFSGPDGGLYTRWVTAGVRP